jgi:hypothetical protein
MECARLVFNIQKGDRITKFDVTWSYDTAEGQHVKGLPFLSCILHISSQLTKRHIVTSVLVGRAQTAEVRSTGRY